jgi:hypothetical protein
VQQRRKQLRLRAAVQVDSFILLIHLFKPNTPNTLHRSYSLLMADCRLRRRWPKNR